VRDTALRRRCQRRLRDLPIPDPFDLDEFCRRLGEQRGRPLTLHQMLALGPDSPSGVVGGNGPHGPRLRRRGGPAPAVLLTLDTYSHFSPALDADAADLIARLIRGDDEPSR